MKARRAKSASTLNKAIAVVTLAAPNKARWWSDRCGKEAAAGNDEEAGAEKKKESFLSSLVPVAVFGRETLCPRNRRQTWRSCEEFGSLLVGGISRVYRRLYH